MKTLLSMTRTAAEEPRQVGGKARSLARMAAEGFPVPGALCLPVSAYRRYLRATGLEDRIIMELGRKDFAEMRWEELWDAALRIRRLFLAAPLPDAMARQLCDEVAMTFGDNPLVVRSSAPGEDSAGASFAGLHESVVNVRGPQALCDAVRRVWASLWSDRALLYRRELGLDVRRSAMAVLIQELTAGEKSGVAFSRSPVDPQRLVVEAVWGLNQGLVDGTIEPDHWEFDRQSGKLLQFRPAERRQALRPAGDGVQAVDLTAAQTENPPLGEAELSLVVQLARRLEDFCGCPQDVEWTFHGDRLVLLQTRAVTAGRGAGPEDGRSWYLSLHRSVANLQQLRRRIEEEILPGMEDAAAGMAAIDPAGLDDGDLAVEIARRRQVLTEWEAAYRLYCIPMAHGVRLFGEFYTDALRPADPFAFVRLLQGAGLRAVTRNRQLADLAAQVRLRPSWRQALADGADFPPELAGGLLPLADATGLPPTELGRLLLELAQQERSGPTPEPREPESLQAEFLAHFEEAKRSWAAELLELARASYRLRDDDNLSLDKIRRQVSLAEAEGQRRLAAGRVEQEAPGPPVREKTGAAFLDEVRVRQLQGQPAGPGVAIGPARVIGGPGDLPAFKAGEILVCDAIDPAMTFVVPLAAGIVERRGGMLIHGAIIAREYGLPCVTGISDAATIIRSGDRITVDGYLGIVVIDRES